MLLDITQIKDTQHLLLHHSPQPLKNQCTNECKKRGGPYFQNVVTFVCFLINSTLKSIIMGLPGESKEHSSFEERSRNVVE